MPTGKKQTNKQTRVPRVGHSERTREKGKSIFTNGPPPSRKSPPLGLGYRPGHSRAAASGLVHTGAANSGAQRKLQAERLRQQIITF